MTMGRTAQDIDLAYRGATDEELTDLAKWRMTQASTGWYLSLYGYASNYVMSLETASSNNGTRITFAQKSNSASKMWILESIPTAPTGVALYNTQSWIAPASTATFKASVYSGSTISQSVTWSSSNTNVAKVNSAGVVTGVSQGTATITAKSTYNTSWSASCTVNVSALQNGTYYIQSKASLSKVVDIKDSNTAAGESIHQFDFEGTNDQKWIFELQQDGYYTIKSVHSNLYLSVKDNSSNSGAEVVQNPDGNADGQRWAIIKTSSGAYKIKAKCAGGADLCLKKGTYVFYPNKLVHMTYTNDSTYDDEWVLHRILPMSGAEASYSPNNWIDFGDVGMYGKPNCYSYALNAQVYPGTNIVWNMQPGAAAGYSSLTLSELTADNVLRYVEADMAALNITFTRIDKDDICEAGTYRVALVVAPYKDYHWYRQDSNGLWSHKRGQTTPTNVDASGNLISDPKTADRNYSGCNYSQFVGYFKIKPLNTVYTPVRSSTFNGENSTIARATPEILTEQTPITVQMTTNIKVGMTLVEVTDILGEPHRILPTGINMIQYNLSDGRHLNIQLDVPWQGDPYVIYYEIVDE